MHAARLHELNSGFEWHDHPGPFRRATPEQVRAYDERGFFLLEDAFDPDEVARVAAEIEPWEARVEAFLSQQEGRRLFIARSNEITFTTHLVSRSPVLRSFCSGPVFQDLVHDLIGPDVRLYWDQAVYKKPGAVDPFPWHQDNGYTFIEPQQYLTCWVALDDATVENGCPWVIPGLHRRGTLAHRTSDLGFVCVEEAPDAVAVPARAGSVVVFSSLTPHATGPNRTDGVRRAYIVQFAPDGAVILKPGESGALERVPADAPERQFYVLRNGKEPRA
ncbi:MAG: phytanoyl-CoA dioxygenase family protein [Deltaproteobacteria bacterium]|nr:phytanoyl-CoA dioxygenase family protein [Deltaproteobacteria bacterium]MBW2413539.1 phytanoyl-CoA dioxygenase family protein [Deltaproteobacteria bacterium]